MLKLVLPDSFGFDEPILELVKVSSRGLIGNDRSQFVKRASSNILSNIDELIKSAKADEPLLHLIAMGATEYTGPNRNGDGWTSDTLRKTHDTFVKHAMFYRDHCFLADTKITLADRTRKNIKDIRVGDVVDSGSGNLPVTAVFKNSYKGPGIKLKVSGVPVTISSTANHPYKVLRREQLHCKFNYNRLSGTRHNQVCNDCKSGLANLQAEFATADSLRAGDYLFIPNVTCGTVAVPPAFASLVGWLASEGAISPSGCLQFTFSVKNTADIASVRACLQANGLHVTTTPTKRKCVVLSASSQSLCNELRKYIRGTLDRKTLTGEILKWDAKSLSQMLTAYIDGDGHVGETHHRGQLRIRSSSRQMLAILSDVCRALGTPATVQYDGKAGKKFLSPTNGKRYVGNGSGVVNVAGGAAATLTRNSRKSVQYSGKPAQNLQFDNSQLVRILSVQAIEIDADVFNLEVAGPHTYIANELLVHNCNKDKTKSYGRVIKSAFNEANPRVELIVALNGSEQAAKRNNGLFADKELQKLASGQEMPVSMACMLPADSCSYCGNMAPSPSDYCLGTDEGGHCKAGGLRNRMGSLVDVDGDLHHLHANNPAPGLRFFDISKVFRPADRTAYAVGQLTKAAAASKQPIKSAELASAVGLTIPITLFEDIYENDGTLASLKIAQQLADIEADIEANITTGVSFSDEYNSLAFSDKTAADNLTFVKLSQDNFSKFLGALSRNKICLPVAGWLHAFTGHSAEKCAHLAELVKPVLPGIYTRMLQDTQLVGQIKHSKYKPVFPHSADATYTAAQPQLQSFSVRKQDIEKRAISACLQLTRSTLVKEAGMLGAGRPTFAEGALLSLAKEYALYKLAFVASAECSPFEARMTVLDNYCT